ncbi:hypothetical protein CRG98_011578 [Punica granatum]|uniref:Uncharacterized protein n=1 Tax=Punica granatum TaxID=22663 RepID=A0A2I0KHH5_PUNGR|nr:hypothetical protein CRG98_011578 [Punica granatum]
MDLSQFAFDKYSAQAHHEVGKIGIEINVTWAHESRRSSPTKPTNPGGLNDQCVMTELYFAIILKLRVLSRLFPYGSVNEDCMRWTIEVSSRCRLIPLTYRGRVNPEEAERPVAPPENGLRRTPLFRLEPPQIGLRLESGYVTPS